MTPGMIGFAVFLSVQSIWILWGVNKIAFILEEFNKDRKR
jgi:hypothetical protein